MDENVAALLAPALAQIVALGTEGSVTRAAARSGTSQPSLSRALRRWEEHLGAPLVEPHGRALVLTGDGRLLAAAASDALRVLEDAVARVRGRDARRVTIGHLRSLGPSVVSELVTSFLVKGPAVLLAHREASSTGIIDGLDAGEIDLALTSPRPPARFAWLPVGVQAFALLIPPTHRLANRPDVGLSELVGEPFLALDRRYHARQVADSLCAAAGIVPDVVVEADDLLTVTNYVAAGLGVAILPAAPASPLRVVSLRIRDAGASREFGLAWRGDDSRGATSALVEHTRVLGKTYVGWADIEA